MEFSNILSSFSLPRQENNQLPYSLPCPNDIIAQIQKTIMYLLTYVRKQAPEIQMLRPIQGDQLSHFAQGLSLIFTLKVPCPRKHSQSQARWNKSNPKNPQQNYEFHLLTTTYKSRNYKSTFVAKTFYTERELLIPVTKTQPQRQTECR